MLLELGHHCTLELHLKFKKDRKLESYYWFRKLDFHFQPKRSLIWCCCHVYTPVSDNSVWNFRWTVNEMDGKWQFYSWFHEWNYHFQSKKNFIWSCCVVFTSVHHNFIWDLKLPENLDSVFDFSISNPINETEILYDIVATCSLLYSTVLFETFI